MKKIKFILYFLLLLLNYVTFKAIENGREESSMRVKIESVFITKQRYKSTETLDHNLLIRRPDNILIELPVTYNTYFEAKKALESNKEKYMTFSLEERFSGIPPITFSGKYYGALTIIFYTSILAWIFLLSYWMTKKFDM